MVSLVRCTLPLARVDQEEVMSTYALWDIPSNSLLLETQQIADVGRTTTTCVSANGEAALDDLLFGVVDQGTAREHSGQSILEAIHREQHPGRTA